MTAKRGVAAAGDDDRATRRGGSGAEICRELNVKRAGAGGGEAAGVGEDVEASGRGREFGGERRDVPRGDDGDVAHGLRAGGIIVEDDQRAAGGGRGGGVGREDIVGPDGRERSEGRAF